MTQPAAAKTQAHPSPWAVALLVASAAFAALAVALLGFTPFG